MSSRDEYVSAMKSAYVSIATRLTLAWVASAAPWAATGIVGSILESLARSLHSFLAEKSEMGVFFKYIDTRVGEQSDDFESAAFENHKIQQSGTEEEKRNAEENLWNKFKPFAQLTA